MNIIGSHANPLKKISFKTCCIQSTLKDLVLLTMDQSNYSVEVENLCRSLSSWWFFTTHLNNINTYIYIYIYLYSSNWIIFPKDLGIKYTNLCSTILEAKLVLSWLLWSSLGFAYAWWWWFDGDESHGTIHKTNNTHRIHGAIVYLPTFTININHSCRYIYQSHGSYGIST